MVRILNKYLLIGFQLLSNRFIEINFSIVNRYWRFLVFHWKILETNTGYTSWGQPIYELFKIYSLWIKFVHLFPEKTFFWYSFCLSNGNESDFIHPISLIVSLRKLRSEIRCWKILFGGENELFRFLEHFRYYHFRSQGLSLFLVAGKRKSGGVKGFPYNSQLIW